MRWFVVAALLALSGAAAVPGASASTKPRLPPNLIVLVVAGQSNALGYQSFVIDPKTHKDVFTDKGASPADRRVLFTFRDSGVSGGALPPGWLDTPQKRTGASSPVFGPEIGLARYLYNAGHKNLLVVKVAISGSSLAVDWAPHGEDLSLLVSRVQAAMAWATNHNLRPTIGGFYWVQGERDATDRAYAADYRTNLVHFIANVRHDLLLKSWTPFAIAQTDIAAYINFKQAQHLCSSKDCKSERLWNSEVMKAQSSVTGKHVFLAKTAKLPRFKDALHMTDAAELSLGTTFGELTRSHI
jgi:hypothetical protein